MLRLQAEAESLGLDVSGVMALPEFARDWQRAEHIMRRYAGEDLTTAERARIAITESSEAFSNGRTVAARTLESSAQLVMREWDAELDACPVCFSMDGTRVGILDNFSIGEPGAVHPFCRCGWTLVNG